MKNYISLKKLLVAILLLTPFSAYAQISEGGTPPSFQSQAMLKRAINPSRIPIKFDVEQLRKEDAVSEAVGTPLRIAYNIDADFDMVNSGSWSILENGQRIWRLSIECPKAAALILKYDKFEIQEGAKLFIYNNDHSQIIGAYTSKTNPKGNSFATEAIVGDNIILEYVEPLNNSRSDDSKIHITGIGYCYNYESVTKAVKPTINRSGTCEVNINCTEGDEWQDQKKGVALTLTPIYDGWYLCSGSIMNNTSGTLKPYYLSAHHCFYDDAKNQATFSQMIFYFHFEAEGCDRPTSDPTESKTMVGAQLLVDTNIDGESDGALLILNDNIPESYKIYYNGWDISTNPAKSGVGIHHPKGDVKKISTYTNPATSATWWDGEVYGAPSAHWNVIFSATANGHGVTEGGSSGSPLFNQNKLIIGTLSGGNSSCINKFGRNLYGKLNQHWDMYAQKMKTYLDPNNTGQTTIDGRYESDVVKADFLADRLSVSEGDSIKMKNMSYRAQTFSWTFEGGSPATSSEKNPTVTYPNPGKYSVKLTVDKGLSTETTEEKTQYVTIIQQTGIIIANSLTAEVDSRKDRINLKWQRRGLQPNDDVAIQESNIVVNRNTDDASNLFEQNNVSNYRISSKWTPADMDAYKSVTIKAIKFIPTSGMESCVIKIKQDGKDLYSKTVNSLIWGQYNTFTLETPVAVDVSKDFFIGYEVVNAESLIASYSGTPIVSERNMLWYDSKNYYAETFGISGNWNIMASATAVEKSDFWYSIYRDDELLMSGITKGDYTDYKPDMSRKSHCYTVDVTFRSGRVTNGDTECINLPDLNNPAILLYDKTSKQVRIVPKSKVHSIHIYNLQGQTISKQGGISDLTPITINTESWGTGVYIIRIKTDQGNVTEKVLID